MELNIFEDKIEDLSLSIPADPFFEIYDGQHVDFYKKPVPVPETTPKKVNLNDTSNAARMKHIQKIKDRLAKIKK